MTGDEIGTSGGYFRAKFALNFVVFCGEFAGNFVIFERFFARGDLGIFCGFEFMGNFVWNLGEI